MGEVAIKWSLLKTLRPPGCPSDSLSQRLYPNTELRAKKHDAKSLIFGLSYLQRVGIKELVTELKNICSVKWTSWWVSRYICNGVRRYSCRNSRCCLFCFPVSRTRHCLPRTHSSSFKLLWSWPSHCLKLFVVCTSCLQDFTVPDYRTHMQDPQGRRRPSLLSEFHPGTERYRFYSKYPNVSKIFGPSCTIFVDAISDTSFLVYFCSSGLRRDAMATNRSFTPLRLSLSMRPWRLNALAWRLLLSPTLLAPRLQLGVWSCPWPILYRTV